MEVPQLSVVLQIEAPKVSQDPPVRRKLSKKTARQKYPKQQPPQPEGLFKWDGSYLGLINDSNILQKYNSPYGELWRVQLQHIVQFCYAKREANDYPRLFDELKPCFGIPKLGTHSVGYVNLSKPNSKVQMYTLIRANKQSYSTYSVDYPLSRIDELEQNSKSGKVIQNCDFVWRVRKLYVFREILGIRQSFDSNLAIRCSATDCYPISVYENSLTDDPQRIVVSKKSLTRWFGNNSISSEICRLYRVENRIAMLIVIEEIRSKILKVVERVNKKLTHICSFIMNRFSLLCRAEIDLNPKTRCVGWTKEMIREYCENWKQRKRECELRKTKQQMGLGNLKLGSSGIPLIPGRNRIPGLPVTQNTYLDPDKQTGDRSEIAVKTPSQSPSTKDGSNFDPTLPLLRDEKVKPLPPLTMGITNTPCKVKKIEGADDKKTNLPTLYNSKLVLPPMPKIFLSSPPGKTIVSPTPTSPVSGPSKPITFAFPNPVTSTLPTSPNPIVSNPVIPTIPKPVSSTNNTNTPIFPKPPVSIRIPPTNGQKNVKIRPNVYPQLPSMPKISSNLTKGNPKIRFPVREEPTKTRQEHFTAANSLFAQRVIQMNQEFLDFEAFTVFADATGNDMTLDEPP